MNAIQDILRAEVPTYFERHRVRPAVRWAAWQMIRCRTSALGGHAEYCPEGHYLYSQWNSCKHRTCALCQWLNRERWVAAQAARFSLSCDYHQVLFTVPHELNLLWSYNRSLVSDALLRAASGAVLKQAKAAVHLGAVPGIISALHTWGRSMPVHLHAHLLVTSGGYTPEGWVACREEYFLETEGLGWWFRRKMLRRLRRALDAGEVVIPGGQSEEDVRETLARAEGLRWFVGAKRQDGGSEGLLQYIGRYMRGGPIRNSQIESYENGRVRFRYHDHKTNSERTMNLPADEFLHRLFEHIPEPGFRTVRYCGVFAPGNREKLAACRAWLSMAPQVEPAPLTVEQCLARVSLPPHPTHCPTCNRELVREEIPRPPGRSPPWSTRSLSHVA
jgi:hypothetical protein